ncbi:MAG: CHASE3 domain-containing protein [Opitutaceae bacterium]|nr:CHASE3 domain-containing protein [Opitutaceae bacterium]
MSPLRPLILSQPAVLASLAVALVLTVGTATLGVVSTRRVVETNARASEIHARILTIQQTMTTLADAETGQRGYLLTGDGKYLEPYRAAFGRIEPLMTELRRRFGGHPERLETLDRLAPLIRAKREEMETTVSLKEKGAMAAALNIIETDDGLTAMASIRRILTGMEIREVRDLKNEGDRLEERAYQFQFLILGMIGVAIALSAVSAALLVRRLRELATMVTVCAWTKRVKWRGQWVSFEEFLEQRFKLRFTHGMSEEAARQFQVEAHEVHEADSPRVPPKSS